MLWNLSALPDELGYDVQPATNTNFGVSEVIKSRLAFPYTSKCQSNWTQTNYTDFLGEEIFPKPIYFFFLEFGTSETYSQTVREYVIIYNDISNVVHLQQCNRICVFAHIQDICKCFHPQYLDYDKNRHFMDPCNLTSTSPGSLQSSQRNQLVLILWQRRMSIIHSATVSESNNFDPTLFSFHVMSRKLELVIKNCVVV